MLSEAKVYEIEPPDFSPQVEISACYIEIGNKLLLLQLSPNKSECGLWGVPAGKIERGETPEAAARRELFEETSIVIEQGAHFLGSLFVRKPDVDYVYHLFRIELKQFPAVVLSSEHQNFKWATQAEQAMLPLMAGAGEALRCYRRALMKKRMGASVNSYLILRQDDKVLLNLRKNTGYADGEWCLIAGHVEDDESATAGMIREAREEIGIEISPSDLKVVHVMHRQTNRLNVDIFFDCRNWKGEIKNVEPEKCEALEFFPIAKLPASIVKFNAEALKAVHNDLCYSEWGWDNG